MNRSRARLAFSLAVVSLVTVLVAWATAQPTLAQGQSATPSQAEEKKGKEGAKPATPAKGKVATVTEAPRLAGEEAPKVFTNADLERMFGPSEPSPSTPSGTAPAPGADATKTQGSPEGKWDPLGAIATEKTQTAERSQKIAQAEKAVAEAEAKVRDLEKRLLAQKNPLLPRPEMTDAEKEAMTGMENSARVELTQRQLEQARQELEKLRSELATAKSYGATR